MEKNVEKNSTETELMIHVRKGHPGAFEQLYKLHREAAYSSLRKLTRDEDLAKEILQDVFLKIWEKKTELKPQQSFRAFLQVMARNKAMDFYRQVKRERQVMENLRQAFSASDDQSLESSGAEEEERQLQLAIEQLPPQRKKIFLLCKQDGKSYVEVGKLLGVSASTISDHIVKANKAIRNQLLKRIELACVLVMPAFHESIRMLLEKII
ncbi:RNA polymerase sigma factor [Pedobacter sp. L105]|uniref:RNA polymerase sigma factor n=1 Tax=Pedobacter sp. L105 TaxID=1641871 RepID=UPI00131D9030|nr:RNA polymerase sigma-70 factor [Pedobacter sp. L105]